MQLTATRSNQFTVTSLVALIEEFTMYGLALRDVDSHYGDLSYRHHETTPRGTTISIMVEGYMPGFDIDSVADRLDIDEDVPDSAVPQAYTDSFDLIAHFLAKDEVAVFIGADINKLAAINAYGVVVSHNLERKVIQLKDDLIDAAQKMNTTNTPITQPHG